MNTLKKEQKIIKVSESILFGGLAKVQTVQPIESGVSKITATPSYWKMIYLRQKLKTSKYERVKDHYSGEWYDRETKSLIVNFEETPWGNPEDYITWRDSIWTFAGYRSLEIWKRLSNQKLADSLGGLTAHAKKSLNGKLGMGNGKFLAKNGQGEWELLKFKTHYSHLLFKPLSGKAIEACRKRAYKKV